MRNCCIASQPGTQFQLDRQNSIRPPNCSVRMYG
jgi:hypothetical protein